MYLTTGFLWQCPELLRGRWCELAENELGGAHPKKLVFRPKMSLRINCKIFMTMQY